MRHFLHYWPYPLPQGSLAQPPPIFFAIRELTCRLPPKVPRWLSAARLPAAMEELVEMAPKPNRKEAPATGSREMSTPVASSLWVTDLSSFFGLRNSPEWPTYQNELLVSFYVDGIAVLCRKLIYR